MTLEQYFHKIVNNPLKELTMFDVIKDATASAKAKWTEFWTNRYEFVSSSQDKEEGWAFVMSTPSYVNEEGETIPAKYDVIQGDNNGTWSETVDQILDVIGKHYGYNIKEQVYYSVTFPMNHPEHAGYGRCLNDEVLQQLLLSHPEVYETKGHL